MKIFVYCRPRDYTDKNTFLRFLQILEGCGLEFGVNEDYALYIEELIGIRLPGYGRLTTKDLDDGSMMISIGGDGTFLHAVRSLRGLPMPIVGVNMGRLGFLASIPPSDFASSLEEIKQNHYSVERRTMLTVTGDFPTTPDFPCALNEFTIHRHTADMIEVSCWIDGHQAPTVRGDGTIISTPTGSTAYSLSAGGPIVTPECSCFVALNIAPHNFSVRPLVLPDSSIIEL
jgi:NAD+ kinase